MNVTICGIDGYLGWALAMYLANRGYDVSGIDNFTRRRCVEEVGSWSATPILGMKKRINLFFDKYHKHIEFYYGDLTEPEFTDWAIEKSEPDAIVHFGEIPSAPYSMIDMDHCNYVQMNNIVGTNNIIYAMKNRAPECHLIKLGTMGEYGVPDKIIPEAAVSEFPRSPGSCYHASKVADSVNVEFDCKIWGLRSTDIMQGVVHGIHVPNIVFNGLLTRFDFDECFGTAINRFCAQSVIGHPITPYGKGGQTRGYLALRDSLQCLQLAIDNPPATGEYRVFNQFDECYSVNELAERVQKVAQEYGSKSEIVNVENPRVEAEEHFYNPKSEKLRTLGFKPIQSLEEELHTTIPKLIEFKDRIEGKREHIMPKPLWRN
jgi:nucleoside-diphosphate-sugar epimerase